MLSFIVPAHNEESLLGATLDAIHASARAADEPYEVIVADDASTDRTSDIAQSRGARVVRVAHRQISATRNSGARVACGDVLVFVDADTTVSAEAVCGALRKIRDGAVGGGAAITFDGAIPLYAKVLLPLLVLAFRATRLAAGCFIFCTRSAFTAVGGFDEAYYGAEEIFISRALGRHGRFEILRCAVTTSGRKLRAHTGRELLAAMLALVRQGRNGVKRREGLELWYAERRDDPQRDA